MAAKRTKENEPASSPPAMKTAKSAPPAMKTAKSAPPAMKTVKKGKKESPPMKLAIRKISSEKSKTKEDAGENQPMKKRVKTEKVVGLYEEFKAAGKIPFGATPRVAKTSKSTRYISWNIAGMRSFVQNRADELKRLVSQEQPDMLALLETKLQVVHEAEMHRQLKLLLPEYNFFFHSCTAKKGYSGVCIATKEKAECTPYKGDDEGRAVFVSIKDKVPAYVCYTPNSGENCKRLDYRINTWDKKFREWIKQKKDSVVIGDLNVAHLDLDIWNLEAPHTPKSAGTTPEERNSFTQLLKECNLVDTMRHFSPELRGVFTYWSVRARNRIPNRGLRLDYGLVPMHMLSSLTEGFVLADYAPNGDHCPIGFTLEKK